MACLKGKPSAYRVSAGEWLSPSGNQTWLPEKSPFNGSNGKNQLLWTGHWQKIVDFPR